MDWQTPLASIFYIELKQWPKIIQYLTHYTQESCVSAISLALRHMTFHMIQPSSKHFFLAYTCHIYACDQIKYLWNFCKYNCCYMCRIYIAKSNGKLGTGNRLNVAFIKHLFLDFITQNLLINIILFVKT